jgi:hypothetical protein
MVRCKPARETLIEPIFREVTERKMNHAERRIFLRKPKPKGEV